MVRAIGPNHNLVRFNLLREPVKPKGTGNLNRARGLFVAANLASILGCGGDASESPFFRNDGGQNCVMIDNLADGNLISEVMDATWSALPGAAIVSSNKVLRAEGQRLTTDGNFGVMLRQNNGAFDTKDYDTLLADVRIRSIADPSAIVTGMLEIDVEGNSAPGSSIGGVVTKGTFTLGSHDFSKAVVVYGSEVFGPDAIPASLNSFTFLFQPPDDNRYSIEIANVELCKTGKFLF